MAPIKVFIRVEDDVQRSLISNQIAKICGTTCNKIEEHVSYCLFHPFIPNIYALEALTLQIPIVNEHFFKNFKVESPHDISNFLPSTQNKFPNTWLKPNVDRSTLFTGYKFTFKDAEEKKLYKTIITKANGTIFLDQKSQIEISVTFGDTNLTHIQSKQINSAIVSVRTDNIIQQRTVSDEDMLQRALNENITHAGGLGRFMCEVPMEHQVHNILNHLHLDDDYVDPLYYISKSKKKYAKKSKGDEEDEEE